MGQEHIEVLRQLEAIQEHQIRPSSTREITPPKIDSTITQSIAETSAMQALCDRNPVYMPYWMSTITDNATENTEQGNQLGHNKNKTQNKIPSRCTEWLEAYKYVTHEMAPHTWVKGEPFFFSLEIRHSPYMLDANQ